MINIFATCSIIMIDNTLYSIITYVFIWHIGLFPVCVEVEADVINPKSTPLTDVSVYGFVKDDDAGSWCSLSLLFTIIIMSIYLSIDHH